MQSPRAKYRPHACFCGVLDWLCPFCGHINRSRVARTGWRIRCQATECRRRFTYGLTLYSLALARSRGRRPLPPPDVTFPAVDFLLWKPASPVHRLITRSRGGKGSLRHGRNAAGRAAE